MRTNPGRIWVRLGEGSGALPVLGRGVAQYETTNTDVFIHRRPVNAFTIADQLKESAFLSRCVQQARKPSERNRNSTSINEVYQEFMFSHLNLSRDRLDASY